MPRWRAIREAAAAPRPHYEFNYDYDGRPRADWNGYDPLLAALIRWHPEHMPAELIPKLARRVSILATAE